MYPRLCAARALAASAKAANCEAVGGAFGINRGSVVDEEAVGAVFGMALAVGGVRGHVDGPEALRELSYSCMIL